MNANNYILFVILITLCNQLLSAQNCKLVDVRGEGIPYANVYVPSLATGVVSTVSGTVQLSPKLATAPGNTAITLSCIGYQTLDTTLAALQNTNANCGLVLQEQAYPLAQAEVSAYQYTGKIKTLGFRKDESNIISSFNNDDGAGDSGVGGAEVANIMKIDEPWLLQTLGTNMEVDTPTVFELNVYAMAAKGEPGERLHTQRILMTLPICTSEVHLQTVDVSNYNIHGKGDFLVSVEVVGYLEIDVVQDTLGRTSPSFEITTSAGEHVDEDSDAYGPKFNSKIALFPSRRLTRCRDRSGEWQRAPLGILAGIWCEVKT